MSCNKVRVTKVCHKFEKHACVESIPVFQLTGKSAYFFVSKLAIDVDGAPCRDGEITPKTTTN
jgi:hypothetical protein